MKRVLQLWFGILLFLTNFTGIINLMSDNAQAMNVSNIISSDTI